MDENDSLHVVSRHFKKVHRVNIAVIAFVCIATIIQSFFDTAKFSLAIHIAVACLLILSCVVVYYLPVRRVIKAIILLLIPATVNIVGLLLLGYGPDQHYGVFIVLAMAALYLERKVMISICVFIDICFVFIFVFFHSRFLSAPGLELYGFLKMLLIVNITAVLVYTITKWARGILKSLMRSNAHLVMANRTLHSSEELLKDSMDSLVESEERFRMVFEEMSDGVMITEENGIAAGCNHACENILGLSESDLNGKYIWDILLMVSLPDHREESDRDWIKMRFEMYASNNGNVPGEYEIIRPDGSSRVIAFRVFAFKTRLGKRVGIMVYDHTERREHEKKIHDLAYMDSVTSLPNRTMFLEELNIRLTASEEEVGALFILNFSRLKTINDIFGHAFGDRLLRDIAAVLQAESPDGFVARLSGGEFAIIHNTTKSREESIRRAAELIQSLDRPFKVEENKIHLAANIGIALFPEAGNTVVEVMKNADAALHKALELGHNRFLVFDHSITDAFREYMTVESGLHSALGDKEFRLYYQPQVDCATGRICGFEALLRWERPDGIVPPNRFIKIAEESGLIVPIGLWVIDEACRFADGIRKRGGKDVSISLNISTLQLVQSDFTEKVNHIVDATGVDRSSIGFEITESAFMQSFDTNVEKLEMLKRSGIEIHLDDFGTGYSSLSYLKRLPIDVVKIDKSFVDDVAAGAGKKDLTGPIVGLAHTLGLKVIAEGVESENQLRELSRYDCDMVQGYLISRPIPSGEVDSFLSVYTPFVM